MTHRVIKPEQVDEVEVAFYWAHRDHPDRVGKQYGPWSVVLACGKCQTVQTFAIDNAAYREALKGELKSKGAVVF